MVPSNRVYLNELNLGTLDFSKNVGGGGGPDERLEVLIVTSEIVLHSMA